MDYIFWRIVDLQLNNKNYHLNNDCRWQEKLLKHFAYEISIQLKNNAIQCPPHIKVLKISSKHMHNGKCQRKFLIARYNFSQLEVNGVHIY